MLNSIAILGRPNVGKSSLFNKLTKTRNAIVSDLNKEMLDKGKSRIGKKINKKWYLYLVTLIILN